MTSYHIQFIDIYRSLIDHAIRIKEIVLKKFKNRVENSQDPV